MKKLRWPIVALTVVVATAVLGSCSSLSASPGLASEPAASLRGGSAAVVNGQYTEGLVVSGTGTASADPEIAQVSFGVELQGQDPDQLVSEAAQKMDAALAAAREFGIAEEKTRTLGYNLWVETAQDPETGRPTGEIRYHLSHQVQVTTNNIASVGELLAGIVNAGANAVSGVNFTVEDSKSLVMEAREAALTDAKERAEHIAGQMGISLGKPILVTEGGGVSPVYDRAIGGGGFAEAAAPSVTPGSFSVSVSVQIVYEIR